MQRVMAFVLVTALFACPALAGLDCATPEQREQSLSELIRAVDQLRDGIERVPPSDAEFIRRESAEAISQSNEARFGIVQINRYFYPLRLHDEVDKVLNALRQARRQGIKRQALKVIEALGYYLAVPGALDDYISFDGKRAHKVLDSKAQSSLYEFRARSNIYLTGFASCLVELLPAN
jgi:hypothetical protein